MPGGVPLHDCLLGREGVRVADLIDRRAGQFKVAACWNEATKRKDETMKENIVHAVAGSFLNSKNGGTLLIGVDQNKNIVGLENDYKEANHKSGIATAICSSWETS